jgi:hypothetical protein
MVVEEMISVRSVFAPDTIGTIPGVIGDIMMSIDTASVVMLI